MRVTTNWLNSVLSAVCALGLISCGAAAVDDVGQDSSALTSGTCLYKVATCTSVCDYTCYPPQQQGQPIQLPFPDETTSSTTVNASCAGGSCAAACSGVKPSCAASFMILDTPCLLTSSSVYTSGCATVTGPAPAPAPAPVSSASAN